MNANDARLVRLYATETGGEVEDNTPTAPGSGTAPPATSFDLLLEAEAGQNVGSSGIEYSLDIVAYDVTAGDNEPALNPTIPAQKFNAGDTGSVWKQSGTNFVSRQRFPITVPNAQQGHTIRYTATLVSKNRQIVSFIESAPFVLVK